MATRRSTRSNRRATAAMEFACCAPLLLTLLLGLWEVGRMAEVQQVVTNCAREAARDASLGQTDLSTLASNLLTYLQGAEPNAFPSSHTTSMIAPVVTLPSNTYGYTCWDSTANREMFTITFKDISATSVTDPTGMSQLDHYQIGVQIPYSSIGWLPVATVTGQNRLSLTVDWACMVDSPFSLPQSLPAQ